MTARPAAMADLTDGTKVRHIAWDRTGVIWVSDAITRIHWDGGLPGTPEVSPYGPIRPADLEVRNAKR